MHNEKILKTGLSLNLFFFLHKWLPVLLAGLSESTSADGNVMATGSGGNHLVWSNTGQQLKEEHQPLLNWGRTNSYRVGLRLSCSSSSKSPVHQPRPSSKTHKSHKYQ